MLEITVLYAGLLGLLSIALGSAAGIMRGRKQIDAGDGGDRDMLLNALCEPKRAARVIPC